MNSVSWGRSIPQHYVSVADVEREGASGMQLLQPGQNSATMPKPLQTEQVGLRTPITGQYFGLGNLRFTATYSGPLGCPAHCGQPRIILPLIQEPALSMVD